MFDFILDRRIHRLGDLHSYTKLSIDDICIEQIAFNERMDRQWSIQSWTSAENNFEFSTILSAEMKLNASFMGIHAYITDCSNYVASTIVDLKTGKSN